MQFLKVCQGKIKILILVFALGIAYCWLVPLTPGQKEPYRILVTNDDGIEAPGIQALSKELRKVGEVIVVAPSRNRSGSSMSLSIGVIFRAKRHEKNGKLFGYGVSGTPADAVIFGIREIAKGKKIDLVVSGINHGQNVGDIARFSGTVGAAMTALHLGIPAVAVSLDSNANDYTFAAQYTARFVSQLKRRGSPKDVILSINIPAATQDEIKGVVPARMGGSYFHFLPFEERQDPWGRSYYWSRISLSEEFESGTDSHAYQQRMITITPLRFDWTDYEVLDKLRTWDLTVN